MRPLWLFAGVIVLSVQVSACASVRQILPATQVLERATVGSTQLESARFGIVLDWTDTEGSLVLQADGVMQNGGKQLGASFTGAYVPVAEAGVPALSIEAAGEVRIVSPEEQYVRLQKLSVLPPEAQLFLNTWWQLPKEGSGTFVTLEVTPDPTMLAAQSQSVRVVRDDGIVRRNDEDTYHYVVTVEPEKLRAVLATLEAKDEPLPEWLNAEQVEGELWIGADDFLLREARWVVRETADRPLPRGTLRFTLDDINDAPAVSVPPNAPVFSFDAFGMPPTFLSPAP